MVIACGNTMSSRLVHSEKTAAPIVAASDNDTLSRLIQPEKAP